MEEDEEIKNIFDAVAHNNIEEIQRFLNEGVDVNSVNDSGDSLLLYALIGDVRLETIKILLDNGADVNFKDKIDYTPLIYAITEADEIDVERLEIIRLLIERGADVNARDKDGDTVLLLAVYDNKIDAVKLLLEKGADVYIGNERGKTVLMIATEKGYLDIIKLLLEKGADVNIRPRNYLKALDLAILYSDKHNTFEIIKLLLDKTPNAFIKQENYKYKCPTIDCKNFISEYFWKKLYATDLKLASQFAKSTAIPKDVWKLILLNKRQQQLCKNLSSDKNKDLLHFFALELNIPVIEGMTKGQLCAAISRQIVYGKIYHDTEAEKRKFKRQIIEIAMKYNIDTDRSLEEIMKDLSKMF